MLKPLSSLEKVFPKEAPQAPEFTAASCLKNEIFSFQVAAYIEEGEKAEAPLTVTTDLPVKLYAVKCVPTTFPCYNGRNDDDYISKEPGLFPDLLQPVTTVFQLVGKQWRSLWVEVQADKTPGVHTVTVQIGEETTVFTLEVLSAELPPQELIYTQWFHCDCIASHYQVPVFSEEHWRLLGNFMENAAKYGMNMILTPVFTPPLDTVVGGERPTVQLVDVTVTESGYEFGYEKLNRYIALAREKGISYFEIAHPFTQWGAAFAPKIVAMKDGKLQKIFGWETSATSPEYSAFIRSFLIALKAHLKELQLFDHCYFHISDEPGGDQLESYCAALKLVEDIYEDCHVMDALSDYSYYEQGLVRKPIPANNHIGPFLENNVPDLWTYYCCGQCVDVSNRFIAMPSARNRIIAHQLYKFNIKGFLHWGYNFWYSQYSRKGIDPFLVTDADEAFPAGDPFSVYPGPGGQPLPSLRQVVFMEALQDQRAMHLLESLTSKEEVNNLLNNSEITFDHYPKNAAFQLAAREAINRRIQELL